MDKSTTAATCITCDTGFYLRNGQCVANTVTHCGEYVTNEDKCATCESAGYTLNTKGQCLPAACEGYKASCTADEYSVTGDTCLSGSKTLLKCVPYSANHCETYSANEDKCASCQEGWEGELCNTAITCSAEYKGSCASGEYKTESDICKSGNSTLYRCTAYSDNHCKTYNANEDKCASCQEGWEGELCNTVLKCSGEYKETCAENEYKTISDICKSGDSTLYRCTLRSSNHCDTYNPNKDECLRCKEGWTGALCNTAATCGAGYKESCTANKEYQVADDICPSGGKTLVKCTSYSTNHCATYNPDKNECATCQEGWTGTTTLCNTAATCEGYQESCASGEYQVANDTCPSGGKTLVKCATYSANHCATFNPNEDKCASCQEGWIDEANLCNTVATCEGYQESCASGEYKTESDTCKKGNQTLYKCTPYSTAQNCAIYSSTSDACLTCKANYDKSGNTCVPHDCGDAFTLDACGDGYYASGECKSGENVLHQCLENGCEGYKESCTTGVEWVVEGDTCKQGEKTLVKCSVYSDMPNCLEKDEAGDTCKTCKEGWMGSKCTTKSQCLDIYKKTCASDEYKTASNTCKNGDDTLYKCTPYSWNHCATFNPNEDKCAKCQDGWTGEATLCNTMATCSDDYKENCDEDEYMTESDTCKKGDQTLYKCTPYSVAQNCKVYSSISDACLTCNANFDKVGNTCVPHDCGEDYSAETCVSGTSYQAGVCKSGTTIMYKCADYSGNHCLTFNANKNECLKCQDGWTGVTTLCNNALKCNAGYKESCTENEEYQVAGDICPSGDKTLVKCTFYSKNNCATYASDKNECLSCQAGWTGETTLCNTAATCGDGYRESCPAGKEYQVVGQTCPSGDKTLVKCVTYSVAEHCATYSATSDECVTCKANYDLQNGTCVAHNCGDDYSTSPCIIETSYQAGMCQSGPTTMYKCNERTQIVEHCVEYNMNSEGCARCVEGLRLYGGRCVIDGQNEEFINPTDIRSGEGRVLPSTDIYGSGVLGENKPDVGEVQSETNVEIVHNDDGDKHTVNGIFAENGNLVVKHDVSISNEGDGDVYGARALNGDTTFETGTIYINNLGGGNVYGLQGQSIVNKDGTISIEANTTSSDAKVYGMCAIKSAENSHDVSINISGSGTSYGMYSNRGNLFNNGTVQIDNYSTGDTYGLYVEDAENLYAINSGDIEINNYSSGTAVGLRYGVNNTDGRIIISSQGDGNAYGILDGVNGGYIDISSRSDKYVEIAGIYNRELGTVTQEKAGTIVVYSKAGDTYGIRNDASQSDIYNQGYVILHNETGTAHGIMSVNDNIVNDMKAHIDVSGDGDKLVGIESLATDQNDTGTITNYGYLDVYGKANEIYGMKGNSVNEGTVRIRTGATTDYARAYGMSGESLENNGSISVVNDGKGYAYGMETGVNNGTITVENNSTGSAMGIGGGENYGTITVTNEGDFAAGMKDGENKGNITISNSGLGYIYGQIDGINRVGGVVTINNALDSKYSDGSLYIYGQANAINEGTVKVKTSGINTGARIYGQVIGENRGSVLVENTGTVREIYGKTLGSNGSNDGLVKVDHSGQVTYDAYGVKGLYLGNSSGTAINKVNATNNGIVTVLNESINKAFGFTSYYGGTEITNSESGVINMRALSTGDIYGMYTANSTSSKGSTETVLRNNGQINMTGYSGIETEIVLPNIYGMTALGKSEIYNAGEIDVVANRSQGFAMGLNNDYTATIINSGDINVNNIQRGFVGIKSQNAQNSIQNQGQINMAASGGDVYGMDASDGTAQNMGGATINIATTAGGLKFSTMLSNGFAVAMHGKDLRNYGNINLYANLGASVATALDTGWGDTLTEDYIAMNYGTILIDHMTVNIAGTDVVATGSTGYTGLGLRGYAVGNTGNLTINRMDNATGLIASAFAWNSGGKIKIQNSYQAMGINVEGVSSGNVTFGGARLNGGVAVNDGTIELANVSRLAVGVKSTYGDVYNAKSNAKVSITINNDASTSTNSKAYGVWTSDGLYAYNTFAERKEAITGDITIRNTNNNGYAKVYGVVSGNVAGNAYNVYKNSQNAVNSKASGNITIENKGGNLYGVNAPSNAYNAFIESDMYNLSTAQGAISIEQSDQAGNIYGVYAGKTDSGDAVNAKASGYGVSAVGEININSVVQPADVNHKIYGVAGYSAYNSLTNLSTSASGTINITASTGDVFGVHGTHAFGAVGSTASLSNIDLTAVNATESIYGNNANLYGVYGTYMAENVSQGGNGTINLTNDGSGIARGVYSGSFAYNVYSTDEAFGGATGTITGTNASTSGDLIGVMGEHLAANLYVDGSNSYDRTAEIELTNNSSSSAYGVYSSQGDAVNIKRTEGDTSATASIKITNNSSGNAYGVKGIDYAINSLAEDSAGAQGKITVINNNSAVAVYGLYADGMAINAYSTSSNGVNYATSTTQGIIDIQNKGYGSAYGLYGDEVYGAWRNESTNASSSTSTITATNDRSGIVYGMRGNSLAVNAYSAGQIGTSGVISINNKGNGYAYGMYGNSSSRVINAYSAANSSAARSSNNTSGSIVIQNNGNGYAFGMHGHEAIGAMQDNRGTTAVSTINITNNSAYSVIGIYGSNSATNAFNTLATSGTSGVSTIKIVNNSSGIAYGLYSYGSDKTINAYATSTGLRNSAYYTNAEINIDNRGSGIAYGVYGKEAIGAMRATSDKSAKANSTIKMTNTGGRAYGIRGTELAANAVSYDSGIVTGTIEIENNGNGTAYGMYATKKLVNAYSTAPNTSLYVLYDQYATGTINITNNGDGTVYGMYGASDALVMSTQQFDVAHATTPKSEINIKNNGLGTAFGMYGSNLQNNSSNSKITMVNPTVYGLGTSAGTVVGMYSTTSASNSGTITIRSDGDAVGMYAKSGTATNKGTININQYNLQSVLNPAHRFYGMYAAEGATITNDTDGVIDISGTNKSSIGMYGAKDSTIVNKGEIYIVQSGILPAYGIYTEGSTVTNTGTININGKTCTGSGCNIGYTFNQYPIYLGGGTLYQLGDLTSTQALSLDSYNGEVVASKESKFKSDEAISGNVAMSSETVMDGFDTVYAVNDIFEAPDTSDLTVSSKSALFDAKLSEDNSDVVMEMKDFEDVVDNASVASFLSDNYEKENNEQLFNTLKAAETTKSLNKNLNEITGQDMFGRFAYEDLTMMRETNYDLNQKLFNNTEEYFSQAGSVSPFAIGEGSASSRYSLTGMRKGNNTIGLSIALADVNTDDGNKHNRRNDHTYTMAMPMGYKSHGFNIITTPTVGYANGTYDRMGLDGVNYDGKVEKQMFGLMNEARYPFEFAGWNFETALEFNLIGYMIEGSEDARDYALNISRQGNYSVEAGFGIYARKEMHPTRKSTLAFNGGVGFYHEFADPYKMRVSMRGMDGSFLIRDEKRGADRAVVRTGFDYSYDNISIYGTLNSYIDRELRTNADLNLKYNF